MTEVISIRMPPETLAELDRRAADSGVDRSKYLMRLVTEDIQEPAPKMKRKFASAHLIGKFQSSGSSNAQVRSALRAQSEKDR
jgi:metal-responsive CopG/Arc/MetJ family transcriptional regulator